MLVLTVLGSLGGVIAFVVALVTVIRGIFGQVHATQDLVLAVRELRQAVDRLEAGQNTQGERIARLEGRQ